MTDLSSYLDTAKGDRSIDAVVAKATSAGYEINRATVARYVSGQGAKNPPDGVLRALAAGLDLDVRDLRELAGKPRGELGPYVPVDEAARLSEDQRRAIDALIKTIVSATSADLVEDRGDRGGEEPTVLGVRRAQKRAMDDEAARDVGREGTKAKTRREQDQAGEPPADNPDDMEPR